MDLYFNFFEIVISQLKHKVTKKYIQELRTKMLTHIEIFFMMFYYERRVNQIYFTKNDSKYSDDFYQWIFGPQMSVIQKSFLQNVDRITKDSSFSEIEETLLFEIAPADIHLKYLFLETDTSEIVPNIIANIYDTKILDKKLTSLMKNEEELDFILDYATDPDNFKK